MATEFIPTPEQKIEIMGYEGIYTINTNGVVYSKYKNINLKQGLTAGYYSVSLFKNGKGKTHRIHRLLAEHFIENKENKLWINHKNGIKTDNRIDNLEWSTPSENAIHACRTGLIKKVKGEKHPQAKLTTKQALIIKTSKGIKSRRELSNTYNISLTQISAIWSGLKWKELQCNQ